MTSAAKSMFVFGIYLLILSMSCLIWPNTVIELIGIGVPGEASVFIRFSGMMALFLALYYFMAARREHREFMWWTVYTRPLVFAFCTVFVLSGAFPSIAAFVGVFDIVTACWTYLALRAAGA
ncbi:hypothetical protein CIG75_11330 [Tumebacillus algifaecis]|uniref:EamA domain-containing protein n=1 Tax=Tumebacillus algifaecis TaxID=1214604 RepID=A0A223D209_9BACL|nr:hypothetical protein [Tumebacillus algifaecis]ASS75515.1 hypothetical protein CIG75_11330 [Tumebacillus algifaecis]